MKLLVLMVSVLMGARAAQDLVFKEEYIWRSLDFVWPDDSSRAEALGRMQYDPESNALAGIKVWRDRIYLTVPRWKRGVPATLVSIPASNKGQVSPLLEPFPSWEMQTVGNCSAFQFVQNIEIDRKGQMWVLDSGRLYTMTNKPESRCRPKLVLLGLQNTMGNNMKAQVLQTYFLPDSVLSHANDSELVDLVLDTDDTVYISDASKTDPGIIVFNSWNAQAWKVSDATMQANPTWHGMVAGRHLTLQSNINALALTPVPLGATSSPTSNRTLFYSPLSSDNLYGVSTYALRNQKLHNNIRTFISDLGNKTSFSQGMTIDSHGIMYLGLNSMDSIARWDTRKLPLEENLHKFSRDSDRMQWPSTFAIDESGSLWVISNRLQNFIAGSVNLDEVNYRVMRAVTNTTSYQYPEERPAETPLLQPSTSTDRTDHSGHMDHSGHSNHTHQPGGMDHASHNKTGNAAESVARPTSVVLTILMSIITFILTSS